MVCTAQLIQSGERVPPNQCSAALAPAEGRFPRGVPVASLLPGQAVLAPGGGLRLGLTRGGVEQQDLVLPVLATEVEHVAEVARSSVERPEDVA